MKENVQTISKEYFLKY